MKMTLKTLQKFATLRHDKRSPKQHQPLAHDELARAIQDMNDMRDCYDSLFSAASSTVNSVYEFSESLREIGDCLLEKTSLNDDEESGKVLLLLGKVQFEIQKLVDGYRSHIMQTITVPSESLLNEIFVVEEMKKQCDEKRKIYEDMMKKQKEKRRLRSSKGDCLHSHQLQEALDEYDEETNVFVSRVKSLKRGQSLSLLTQASRHHAAQLSFFKKALRSLEAIEPLVRLVAEQQHIDYQFDGLKDDRMDVYEDEDEDEESDSGGDFDTEDGSELSYEHGQNGPVQEDTTLKNSMELDDMGSTFSPAPKLGAAKETFRNSNRKSLFFQRDLRPISKSAPLFPDKKLDSAEWPTQKRPLPSRKFTSYVLPTPDETTGKLDNKVPQSKRAASNLWHSSPLGQNKVEKSEENYKLSEPIILDTQSVLKESNNSTKASRLPPPLSESLPFKQFDPNVAKKFKRQAFSGPLTGKTWSNNPSFSVSGPIPSSSSGYPFPPLSGSLLRTPLPKQPTLIQKFSSRFSPSFVSSSPKISELHELPRPPVHLVLGQPTTNSVTHSGPLIMMSKRNELSTTARASAAVSVLPMPLQALPRTSQFQFQLEEVLEKWC